MKSSDRTISGLTTLWIVLGGNYLLSCNKRPVLVQGESSIDIIEADHKSTQADLTDAKKWINETRLNQGQLEDLESSLESNTLIDQWADAINELDQTKIARDGTYGEAEKAIKSAEDRFAKIESQLAVINDNRDPSLGKSDVTDKIENTAQDMSDTKDNMNNLKSAIAEFDLRINEGLDAIIVGASFRYDQDNPEHYFSSCLSGKVTELRGRSGSLVDQFTIVCGSAVNDPIGGNGGQEQPVQTCPENHVAIGIFGGEGDSVDRVGLLCSTADYVSSRSVADSGFIGNSDGGEAFIRYCPLRTALIGLTGTVGVVVSGTITSVYPVCKRI